MPGVNMSASFISHMSHGRSLFTKKSLKQTRLSRCEFYYKKKQIKRHCPFTRKLSTDKRAPPRAQIWPDTQIITALVSRYTLEGKNICCYSLTQKCKKKFCSLKSSLTHFSIVDFFSLLLCWITKQIACTYLPQTEYSSSKSFHAHVFTG